MAAHPPTDLNPEDLDDEDEAGTAGEDEEFIHYTITAPLKGPASPPEVARHLEARLRQLQRQDSGEDGKGSGKSGGKSRGRSSRKGGARGERRRSSCRSSSRALQECEEAEAIIQQILNVDHRGAYEEYQRMVGAEGGSGPIRRPEVTALQQEEGSAKRGSRNASPSRQPRRQPSRDVPREDRDGSHSPAPVHRRPSRDVPLNPAQMDRLTRVAGGAGAAPQAWPDLIVAPQGEADEEVREFSLDVPVASLLKSPSGTLRSVPGLKVSSEPEGDTTPAPTHKGAPSLTPPPSPPSEHCNKHALSSPPSPITTHKDALAPTPSSTQDSKPALTPPPSPALSRKGSEEPPSRLVAWILDIGSSPPPPRQNSSGSLQDRVTHWEARDGGAPRSTPSPRLSPSPRPSPSPSPSRRPHERSPLPCEGGGEGAAPHPRPHSPFSVLSRENNLTETEKVIQTPWGALKRSPSRTSFSKSPSREREASPVGPAKTTSPAPGTPSQRGSGPAQAQDGLVGWAAGGKSHTLPRSAKLMRQKSMGSVAGGVDAPQPEADGGLKRKSKFPPSPNKRPLTPLLFTAQDRISMFEKSQPTTRGPPRPLARTRSSVTLGSNAPPDPRTGDRSQVGFMKTRLLGKVGRGAGPTLPEEPATPDPCRRSGPDAA